MPQITKRIAIIGGGASGALTAIHCWSQLGSKVEIVVFDSSAEIGRGKAYGVSDLTYLLNVPAENMSAEPESSEEFVQWLFHKDPALRDSPHWPFVPRAYFGQYLQDRLRDIPLSHIRSRVEAIEPRAGSYDIRTADDRVKQVDYVIIATGYQETLPEPTVCSPEIQSRIVQATVTQAMSGNVLVVGSGLTAIDIWRCLSKSPDTRVTFLSRRGLVPQPHELSMDKIKIPQLSGLSPRQIFQFARSIHQSRHLSWAQIADCIRPHAESIWRSWTLLERSRFLRHVKPYWEVVRHRVPASVWAEMRRSIDTGHLNIKAGRVTKIEKAGNQAMVTYRNRKNGQSGTLTVDWIVLATGDSIEQSLVKTNRFGLRRCSLGLGYINESAPRIWTVGPSSKGEFWECGSIPEIRLQARAIACAISNDQKAWLPI